MTERSKANKQETVNPPTKLRKGSPEEVAVKSIADCWTCQNSLSADELAARVREVAADVRRTRERAALRKAAA